MHILISSKLDFSIGDMTQTHIHKLGDTAEIQDYLISKILSYSSDWCKC